MSVVIPAYNEEEMIEITAKRICELLNKENINYELIFANDGSKDNTWNSICRISNYMNVVGLNFSRNFGKEAAVFAGINNSKGKCCVVIDCDLQHPPEVILEMYGLWKQGYEVIHGVKKYRDKSLFFIEVFQRDFIIL